MEQILSDFLTAILAAVIPIVATFIVQLITKLKDKTVAETEDVRKQYYIAEISDAVANAVAATSQTYVDALKKNGSFDKEAQKEAAQMALGACLSSISADAKTFIEAAYGDITRYLTDKIEAEVRKQKTSLPITTDK